MSSRPAIPADIVRRIMIEAGHRCAVCGTSCPLEKAHIVPWSKGNDHSAANLICLCANCHETADREPWDRKTFEEYKRNPWVNRQYGNATTARNQKRKLVQVTLDLSKAEFDETEQEWLRHGLASFLDISPKQVEVVSVKEGSVKIMLSMPKTAAERLQAADRRHAQVALQPLRVLDIAPAGEEIVVTSEGQGYRPEITSPPDVAARPSNIWDTLITDLLPRLLRFGIARGLPTDEVSEAVSAVLVQVHDEVGVDTTPDQLWSLAVVEMRRQVLDWYVKTRRERLRAELETPRITESQPFGSIVEQYKSSAVDAIVDLPEPTRSCLVDHYFRELSHDDIARKYAISRPAVRHHISRGLRRVREVVGHPAAESQEEHASTPHKSVAIDRIS